MNKQNGTAIISEEEHIKQSVSDILLTQIGTRIQRRDYGSNIPKLIDRPINGALMLQIAACAVVALTAGNRAFIFANLNRDLLREKSAPISS